MMNTLCHKPTFIMLSASSIVINYLCICPQSNIDGRKAYISNLYSSSNRNSPCKHPYCTNPSVNYMTVTVTPKTIANLPCRIRYIILVPTSVHLIPSANLNAAISSSACATIQESTARLSAIPSTA
jgi:hypothetical protein